MTTNHSASQPLAGSVCDCCGEIRHAEENEYGEFICDSCEDNRAEAAYERFCEDFHDGGATQFKSLRDQQIDALKFK